MTKHFYIFEEKNMPDIQPPSFKSFKPWLLALLVLIMVIALLVVKDRKSEPQQQAVLERKTRQAEILLNNFVVTHRGGGGPSSGKIINRHFFKLPQEVERARQESAVVVRFSAAHIVKDQMGTIELASSGFVTNDSGSVITALHTLGDVPADWNSPLTSIEINDGHRFFDAMLDKYDWIADLAFLQIKDWPNTKSKFQKRPIMFASLDEKNNLGTASNFYGFCFIGGSDKEAHNLPVIFGPYLSETNIVSGEVSPVAFGVIGGSADNGCSGSPLVGQNGRVYGVVSRTTATHTYVATLEELLAFIKSDQLTITERLISAQKNQ